MFIKNLAIFFELLFKNKREKKDVLLVVQDEIMFSYVREIYENLKNDKRLRLWFKFLSPKRFNDQNQTLLKEKYQLQTVPKFVAKKGRWDLILLPAHYRGLPSDCKKILVGHSLTAGKKFQGKAYRFCYQARDNNNIIIYEKIFVESDSVAGQACRLYPEAKSKIRVVGSMHADNIKQYSYEKKNIFKRTRLDPNRLTVMVASTWGAHSLIQAQGETLENQIPEIADKYNLIISLHLRNFVHPTKGDRNCMHFLKYNESKNVHVISPGVEAFPLLANTDILVTDHTSLGLYFPPFHRPIITYINSDLDLDGTSMIPQLRKVSYQVGSLNNLVHEIEQAITTFDKDRMKVLSEKVCSYQGRAWERVREEIYDSLSLTEPEPSKKNILTSQGVG